jgi:outer membrane protein assembly factor BamE
MRFLVFLIPLFLAGCFLAPYKVEIRQGNYVDDKMLSKVKLEMTRDQVLFALGTPLIIDPFHPNRWDYVYMDGRAGKVKRQRGITLWFDADRLVRVDGNIPLDKQGKPPQIDAANR